MVGMCRRAILFVSFLLPLWGAEPATAHLGRRQWTSAQGLPQDTVLAMTQTHDGYLWLGTEGGLARFDGVRFTIFDRSNTPGLGSNFVQALAEDRAGVLWIGTAGGGLSRWFHGSMERFRDEAAPERDTVYALYADQDGSLWVGTEKGLGVIRHGRAHWFTAAEGSPGVPVYSVTKTADGSVWFATYGQGLGRYRQGRVTLWKRSQGLADNRVVFLQSRSSSSLWVASYGGALQEFDGSHFSTYAVKKANASLGIWAICRDSTGGTWLGSYGAGLGVADQNRVRYLSTAEGVPAENVWSLLEDREGNLWVGSSEGLFQFRHLPLRTYLRTEGLPSNVVSSVWEDRQQRLWIGTSAGLVQWRKEPEGSATREIVTTHQVLSMAEDGAGTLWLGTADQGLLRLRHGTSHPVTVPGAWGNRPIHVLVREGPALLVGTFGAGLFVCQTETASFSCAPVTAVKSDRVMTAIRARNGDWWVGTREGLMHRHGEDWQRLTTADGLGSNLVTALYEDRDGDLWIGTEGGGLARHSHGFLVKANSQQGALDDIIYSIQEDDGGQLWMSSPRGVFRLEKDSFPGDRYHSLKVVNYGLLDGMLATQCSSDSPNAACRTRDGALWFSTMKGLVRTLPRELRINKLTPPVLLEETRIDGRPVPLDSTVRIPPGSHRLEVVYTGLSLTIPEKQHFRYRLAGFEENWIEAGYGRVASYTNVPPGDYAFEVQGSNNDGVWGHARPLRLKVQAYFYQTRWFTWTIIFCAAATMFFLYRLRMRQLDARHALVLSERTRIAQELHDTLLQDFSGVSLQLGVVEQRLRQGAIEAGQERLDRVMTQVDRSLTEARESVWDLRSPFLAESHLGQALVSLCEDAGTPVCAVHCHVDPNFPALPYTAEKQFWRIAQESLANSLRHAQATEIWVKLVRRENFARLSVRDNGCGFDPEQAKATAGGHWGLIGMRERARQMNARFTVRSEAGKGTEVMVEAAVSAAAEAEWKNWFRRAFSSGRGDSSLN